MMFLYLAMAFFAGALVMALGLFAVTANAVSAEANSEPGEG